MIERIVQKVLTAAVAAIRADTSILDSIFQPDDDDIRISAAELVKIKADFVALNGAVPRFKVRSGYAVNENHVPSFSVVLQNERQAHRALGDYVGDAEDSTTHALLDPAVELIGSIEDRTIAVLAYGWTPDECYWYYKILKAIILLNLSTLICQRTSAHPCNQTKICLEIINRIPPRFTIIDKITPHSCCFPG